MHAMYIFSECVHMQCPYACLNSELYVYTQPCHVYMQVSFLAYDIDGSGALDADEACEAFAGAMVDVKRGKEKYDLEPFLAVCKEKRGRATRLRQRMRCTLFVLRYTDNPKMSGQHLLPQHARPTVRRIFDRPQLDFQPHRCPGGGARSGSCGACTQP